MIVKCKCEERGRTPVHVIRPHTSDALPVFEVSEGIGCTPAWSRSAGALRLQLQPAGRYGAGSSCMTLVVNVLGPASIAGKHPTLFFKTFAAADHNIEAVQAKLQTLIRVLHGAAVQNRPAAQLVQPIYWIGLDTRTSHWMMLSHHFPQTESLAGVLEKAGDAGRPDLLPSVALCSESVLDFFGDDLLLTDFASSNLLIPLSEPAPRVAGKPWSYVIVTDLDGAYIPALARPGDRVQSRHRYKPWLAEHGVWDQICAAKVRFSLGLVLLECALGADFMEREGLQTEQLGHFYLHHRRFENWWSVKGRGAVQRALSGLGTRLAAMYTGEIRRMLTIPVGAEFRRPH